uniref:Gylcosyl hydrolase 115 C-terminal domain-containing protein n=1 Tax=Fusarium sporotrichioides TaxID=5514 RepID=Q876Y1_FUSSP|nr:unknown [Fusarium sporotrichioides]
MFEEKIVDFEPSAGSIPLVGATIVVDQSDYPGIIRAAKDLAQDFGRVTKGDPSPVVLLKSEEDYVQINTKTAIFVGSIGSSPLIKKLVENGKLDIQSIDGKWESFAAGILNEQFGACERALIIAGSDKRGAIFGIYTLSEQIGVSPWYWWADVPPKYHTGIHAIEKQTVHGEPSVRHRGIFLNDEAPALTGWVRETFGGYNSKFYATVFELLLRLKANFLWPAMWPGYPNPGASFFTDDPLNQKLADEYGIVISTSHHEPMQRLSNEWFADNPDGSWNWLTNKQKITEFFEHGAGRAQGCDSYFTLGIRGEYDKKMLAEDPASVVQDAIETQRKVIEKVYGSEGAVPQLFAIYKEVQSMFETGRLTIPEDVTLLFQDDNFGTIRRLPTTEESKRKGGAGVYYHLQYVGDPRSYKWINTNSLGKVWHQLQQAYHHNARQIWVFNVGDLKPQELPISFAMALAWDINSIKNNTLPEFFHRAAEREFGTDLADEIGSIWHQHDRLLSLRKHEHIEPETFSILHYKEADSILNRWKVLLSHAERLHSQVTEEQKAASFQLILHPTKASYIYTALRISQARNRLFARQRRNSANKIAQEILDLFDADFDLSEEFHSLLNGKWNHILMQPHYGYEDTWHAPSRDMISGLSYVQRRQNSNPIVGQMGVAVEGHEGVRVGRINEESERTHPSRRDLVPGLTLGPMSLYGPDFRWFDVFTRGVPTINWSTSAPYPWIILSRTEGVLVPGQDDVRVQVSINWSQVPQDFQEEVLIDVQSREGDFEQVHLLIDGRHVQDSFRGFVEQDCYISIPATDCHMEKPYLMLPDTGRLETGSVTLAPGTRTNSEIPYMKYPLFTHSETDKTELVLYFGTTLDLSPEDVLTYDVQIDEGPSQTYNLQRRTPQSEKNAADKGWASADGWFFAASDNVWVRRHELGLLKTGVHNLKLRLNHANILLEKVVVDFGGVQESYLGPPGSTKA